MKTLVYNYYLEDNINPEESIKGTYWFKVPDDSKKTVGNYFKEHMDHLFSFGFLTNGGLNHAWIRCYNLEDVAEDLPETLVSQLQVIIDDWETTRELLLDDTGCLSEKTMRDLLLSLSAEELYDLLFNEYYLDVDMMSTTYRGTLEEDDEEGAEDDSDTD